MIRFAGFVASVAIPMAMVIASRSAVLAAALRVEFANANTPEWMQSSQIQ